MRKRALYFAFTMSIAVISCSQKVVVQGEEVSVKLSDSVAELMIADSIAGPRPLDFVPAEREPIPLERVSAEYPAAARQSGEQGTVWVKLWVTSTGIVKQASIMKSDNAIFNKAALKAAIRWKYQPAIFKGKPTPVWASVPFAFKP